MSKTSPPDQGELRRMSAAELKDAARTLSESALETLKEIMRGTGQDSVRLAAAREVLDRAHGKVSGRVKRAKAKSPASPPGMTVIVKRFSDVTPEEEAAADATERGEW